jgi:short-subunit dehydrogenase
MTLMPSSMADTPTTDQDLSRKENHMVLQLHGTAMVTGASSGLGAVYADRLARRGYNLILVARSRERLDDVARRLTHDTGRSVEVVAADLTDPTDLGRVEQILKTDASITMLVNNAGIGAGEPAADAQMDKMESMIAVNIGALTRLTYAALPGFLKHNTGNIINISSIVAIWPEILNGVYAGTKAFVTAFSQSLSNEMTGTNIRVQVVVPGAIATGFWHAAGVDINNFPAEAVMTADDLVDAALAGFDLGELVTIPSLPEYADWAAYEAARKALIPNISRSTPAERYRG